MADTTETTWSSAQVFAQVEAAVQKETAALTVTKENLEAQLATLTSEKAALNEQLTQAQTKLDVLEVEKADAEAKAQKAADELEDFKQQETRAAELAAKKVKCVDAIKAARDNFPDDFFNDTRMARWAAMSDEEFGAYVDDLKATAPATASAQLEGGKSAVELARESAAFTGGLTATTAAKGSALSGYLNARNRRGSVTA